MAHLYLDSSLKLADVTAGQAVTVAGDEARHAVKVARLRAGEEISVGDGAGVRVTGVVQEIAGNSFTVSVTDVSQREQGAVRFTLVQALAKGDRAERAVESATECGIDRIIPWQATRSISRWDSADKGAKGRDKWQKIAHEAAKQAMRYFVPVVENPYKTADIAGLSGGGARLIILDPYSDKTIADSLQELPDSVREIVFVVGPEGGLTSKEIDLFVQAGAIPVKLGPTVLRTSTAGTVALALAQAAIGSWAV